MPINNDILNHNLSTAKEVISELMEEYFSSLTSQEYQVAKRIIKIAIETLKENTLSNFVIESSILTENQKSFISSQVQVTFKSPIECHEILNEDSTISASTSSESVNSIENQKLSIQNNIGSSRKVSKPARRTSLRERIRGVSNRSINMQQVCPMKNSSRKTHHMQTRHNKVSLSSAQILG